MANITTEEVISRLEQAEKLVEIFCEDHAEPLRSIRQALKKQRFKLANPQIANTEPDAQLQGRCYGSYEKQVNDYWKSQRGC